AFVPESLQVDPTNADDRPLLTQLEAYVKGPSNSTWAQRLSRANPFLLLRILSPSNPQVSKTTSRNLLALSAINTILFGAIMGAMNVMMLYSEFRFGWGNKESGFFLSPVNVFRPLAPVAVLPLIIYIPRRFFHSKSNSTPS